MAPSQKRFLISLLPALLLALAAAACGREDARGKNLAPAQESRGAAPAVTVAQVAVEDVAPGQSFIVHVIAIQAVQVVPRVTACIDDVPVKQGSDVKAGQVLYELQKEQYRAAVEAARAQLASAKAALWQAQIAYERAAELYKRGAGPKSTLDQATATRDQDQANVQAAQANLDQAELNLSYCTIASPIDGRIGAITLTKGNLVTPVTPPLATVNQLDPIRVVFPVSDRLIVRAEQRTNTSARQIAKGLTVSLELPGGALYDQHGTISFLGNEVDTQTGTVNVYADFPNPDALLLPGAYVTVAVRRAKPERRPLVPAEAVQTEQAGSFVLVVGNDNKVRQQPIELGRQIAQSFIVKKGLSGGERVIIQGVQKVHPGETVTPLPAPAASGPNSSGEAG